MKILEKTSNLQSKIEQCILSMLKFQDNIVKIKKIEMIADESH